MPTILAPSPNVPTEFGRLFHDVLRDEVPLRVLEGRIFKALEEKPGDDWSDDFEEDVWHRRDPEDHCAFDVPPRYLTDATTALSTRTRAKGEVFEITERDGRWEARTSLATHDGVVIFAQAASLERAVVAMELLRRHHVATVAARPRRTPLADLERDVSAEIRAFTQDCHRNLLSPQLERWVGEDPAPIRLEPEPGSMSAGPADGEIAFEMRCALHVGTHGRKRYVVVKGARSNDDDVIGFRTIEPSLL